MFGPKVHHGLGELEIGIPHVAQQSPIAVEYVEELGAVKGPEARHEHSLGLRGEQVEECRYTGCRENLGGPARGTVEDGVGRDRRERLVG